MRRGGEVWAGGPGWGGVRGSQQEWPAESSNQITSYLLLGKAALLTRELGQDDFGKPRVVLAAQTFSFLLGSLLIIGWELLFTFREEAIPVRCFSEGFHLTFAKHTQFQMQL